MVMGPDEVSGLTFSLYGAYKARGIIFSLESTTVASLLTIKQRIIRYSVDTWTKTFDLDIWPHDLKINREHLVSM